MQWNGCYFRDSAVYKTMQTLPEVTGVYSNISLINAFKVLFIKYCEQLHNIVNIILDTTGNL